ncbi:MAG: bacillithiol system redox-active protein YtxJ [Bacteroidota bacterium]
MAKVKELHVPADFDALLDASHEQPVALLKHSISCPISAGGQKEFVKLEGDDDPPLYGLVVQYVRELSNEIAERLDVQHETPQALLISGGEVVYHASHYDISADALRDAARQARQTS